MGSSEIGARLRRERVGQGLTIDDIARNTRIKSRFLEAIETDDFSDLPGLVFTRNFIRQYALTLKLDPVPLLAELPKQDESTVPLPNPPARPRSSYYRKRRRAILSFAAWLIAFGVAGAAAYMYFNHSAHTATLEAREPDARAAAPSLSPPIATSSVQGAVADQTKAEQTTVEQATNEAAGTPRPAAPSAPAAPVQVSLTASERAWVQVSVDGKTTFIGTLTPNETREVSAAEQVRVVTGNAGALKISLNGRTLESLGSRGQVREVRLTAEGPQFPSKDPQPAPDPL